MHEHDERSRSDVINTPGEADQHDGGHVMNDLLLEVLQDAYIIITQLWDLYEENNNQLMGLLWGLL